SPSEPSEAARSVISKCIAGPLAPDSRALTPAPNGPRVQQRLAPGDFPHASDSRRGALGTCRLLDVPAEIEGRSEHRSQLSFSRSPVVGHPSPREHAVNQAG